MCSLLTLLGAFLVRYGLSTTPSAATGTPTDTATAAPRAQYEPGIVSYWKCDEGAGTTASDSADANNGTLDGATWTTGKIGNALSFDGNDRVVIPDSPSLDPSTITVETWVRLDRIAYGPGDEEYFISKGGDTTTGAYILNQSGPSSSSSSIAFVIAPYWSGWGVGTPLMTLETNRWYHVAGTYDGNTMKIYLDGILQGSEDVGSIQVGNSSPLYFGYDDVGGFPYYLDGSLDEVAIYNRALTASEIQSDYQHGLNNPVGGIAEYPQLEPGTLRSGGSPARDTFALALGVAGGTLLLTAGGWYARRRWLRQRP
jgi:hypothetical protein